MKYRAVREPCMRYTAYDSSEPHKFCSHCGKRILAAAVICPACGCQVGELVHPAASACPPIVINNTNTAEPQQRTVVHHSHTRSSRKKCYKSISFLLCLFFGILGAHKFYEDNIPAGIAYLLSGGLFGIGWLVDLFAISGRPSAYYV